MLLGQVLKIWREQEWRYSDEPAKRGLREVSETIGTSPATLSRFERGEEISGETLAMILKWLLTANK